MDETGQWQAFGPAAAPTNLCPAHGYVNVARPLAELTWLNGGHGSRQILNKHPPSACGAANPGSMHSRRLGPCPLRSFATNGIKRIDLRAGRDERMILHAPFIPSHIFSLLHPIGCKRCNHAAALPHRHASQGHAHETICH
jgi:hypothetical protein